MRQHCELTGVVSSVERSVRPIYLVEVVIDDGTGHLPLYFFGNRRLSNLAPGDRVQVNGTLVRFRGRPCLLNPVYELLDRTRANTKNGGMLKPNAGEAG